jgi:EmrB/QacA subfamily drug resistance transporter
MPLSPLGRSRPASGEQNPDLPEMAGRGVLSRLASPSVLLFVILTAQLMVVLDTTIVNVALPHIQESLGFSTGGLSWVINAYILTFGGFLLLGARAGDLFGRRRVFLVGIAVFTASSFLGGLAESGWMLLAARALQGTGAALAAPSALSLLTVSFSEGPARVRAIGLYTTVSAAGGAIGLIAGGLLTQLVSWRWVMFVNVPIGIAVFLVGRMVLAETDRRNGHFDLFGAMSCTVGIGSIVFGLVEAGQVGWASPVTVIAFVLGATLLAAFFWHEGRAVEPILPLRLLASRTRSAANAARGLLYAGFYGLFYFLAQFLQDVHGYSPLRAGLAFLPMPLAVFLSSQFTTRVLAHRLPEKMIMVIGGISATVGLLLATEIGKNTSYLQIVVSLLLIGAGSGMALVAMTSASLADVEPEVAGAASGLVNVSQQIGAAVGLAVLVTAFNAFLGHGQLASVAAVDPSHVVHSFDAIFAVSALFSLAALLMVIFGVRGVKAEDVVLDDATGDPVLGDPDRVLELSITE